MARRPREPAMVLQAGAMCMLPLSMYQAQRLAVIIGSTYHLQGGILSEEDDHVLAAIYKVITGENIDTFNVIGE